MSRGKNLEAESINDILSAAYAQQQSGLISAECVQGGRRERGELYVFAGQPVYARVEKLSGQEALKRLLTWRNISFSFDAEASRPPANLAFRVEPAPLPVPARPLPITHPRLPAPGDEEQGYVPQKVDLGPYTLPPLTHRQRLIYFLIDGQRTVADLSRCSGKTILEVKSMLYELQQSGLIIILAPNS